MQYSDHALNVLTAKTYKGIGRAWIAQFLSTQENVDKIIFLLNKKLKNTVTREDFLFQKEKIAADLEKNFLPEDGLIAIGDRNFPHHRGEVKNSEKPIFLFYRGDIRLLSKNYLNIAVIGLRDPDPKTQRDEEKIVQSLVKKEAVIVSGLALGCDSIAHRAALANHGKTIAILPSPLHHILPSQNISLAEEIIAQGGLLISEYQHNFKTSRELNGRYQERDRLQALFSDYIILAASYAKNDQGNDSGARLAMAFAQDYQIPRAVMYEEKEVNNPKYDLNRQLISEDKNIFILNSQTLETFLAQLQQKIKPISRGQDFLEQKSLF